MHFDPSSGRWYADVELAGELGYRPWVALALARHQVDAIAGQQLSPVRREPPRRLGRPDACRSCRRWAGIRVTVSGDDHDGVPDERGGLAVNEVTIRVQQADAAVADPDLRWVDTAQVLTLTRTARGAWSGDLVPVRSGAPLRLLLVETEPAAQNLGAGVTVQRITSFVEVVEL